MITVTPSELVEQRAALLKVIGLVGRAIQELGEVPSGELYARLMAYMSLDQYEQIIGVLKGAGVVRETGAHLLTWAGPMDGGEVA